MHLTKEMLLNATPVFLNDFGSQQDVFNDFEVEDTDHYRVLYADYTYENYSGDAYVLGFDTRADKFFEVHGSHCSCYGLENQWDVEYITVEALQEFVKRRESSTGFRSAMSSPDFYQWLGNLVKGGGSDD